MGKTFLTELSQPGPEKTGYTEKRRSRLQYSGRIVGKPYLRITSRLPVIHAQSRKPAPDRRESVLAWDRARIREQKR